MATRTRPGAPYLESPRLPALAKAGGATSERITRSERRPYAEHVVLPAVREGYFAPLEGYAPPDYTAFDPGYIQAFSRTASELSINPSISSRKNGGYIPYDESHAPRPPPGNRSFSRADRFAEAPLARDLRMSPGPGQYAVPGGMGKQVNSIRRSNRASAFAPPPIDPAAPSSSATGAEGGSSARMANLPEAVASRLRRRLRHGRGAIEALASMWDSDRDGKLGRRELFRGLLSLGLQLSEADMDVLFKLYDTDQSGGIDMDELREAVQGDVGGTHSRSGVPMNRDGGRFALRRGKLSGHGSKALGGFMLSKVDAKLSVQEQLRNALTRQAVRVIDLFREWDTSVDGLLSKREFEEGVRRLGLDADPASIAGLFDSWDEDRSGEISLMELNKILRRGGAIVLDKSLQATDPAVLARLAAKERARKAQQLAMKLKGAISRKVGGQERGGGGASALSPAQEKLLKMLGDKKEKIVEFFRSWDVNSDGYISKREFHKSLPLVGVVSDKAVIDALFDTMDFTGEGRVEVAHVEKALKWACKSRKSALLRNVTLDYEEGPHQQPLHEQLRDALVSNAVRVIDLFREWDEDGDGEISRTEFQKALPLLGLTAPREVVDLLFESFDTDGSGQISFKEFNKLLRRDPKAEARKKAVQAIVEEDVEVVDRSVLKREVMRECSKLTAGAQARAQAAERTGPAADLWAQSKAPTGMTVEGDS